MHAVTCRTEGCMNNGYTLILTDPGHTIICGPCGQPITQVQPVVPENEHVEPEPVEGPVEESEGPEPEPDTETVEGYEEEE